MGAPEADDAALPDAVLRYAGHDDGVVDVHLPRTRAHTRRDASPDSVGHGAQLDGPGGTTERVVVLLHGGFWRTAYDRRHTRMLARALADDGFVVATPEYRRVGPGGGGGWPATGRDVVEAVRALPGLLAGIGVRAGSLAAVGHSAGGHLALWLATTGAGLDGSAALDGVVALAPVCDLREAIRRGLGADAARAFLGEIDPDAADPMLLLDDRPPAAITLLHGTDDEVVPIDLSRGLVARHPWVRLVEVPGDHFAVIEPAGPAYEILRGLLRSLGDPA